MDMGWSEDDPGTSQSKEEAHRSTSFLYHGFGIQGYAYLRTRYVGTAISFSIRQNPE